MHLSTLKPAISSAFSPQSEENQSCYLRTLELLKTEIEFISNSHFHDYQLQDDPIVEEIINFSDRQTRAPAEMPAHLQRMCETDLLTSEQEQSLFRQMNFCKFKANTLRSRLDPQQLDPSAIHHIDSLLSRAQQIRDHIIQANTRLVISIVKKFVSPQISFDDLLSDGLFILMRAVEKFDFGRGFRFSTYVYRSVTREAYHIVKKTQAEETRTTRDAQQWAFCQEENNTHGMSEELWDNLRQLTATLLEQLDRREQFIIRCRYALGAHRKARTFQYIADKLGISKERARQLERRAVAKLQAKASEFEIDALPGLALA